MWYRLPRKEYEAGKGGANRRALRSRTEEGAPAVEAYPVIPKKERVPPVFASQGLLSAYLKAGFREVERPSPARAIVRYGPE